VGPKGCAGADGTAHVALLGGLTSVAPDGPAFASFETNDSLQMYVFSQRPEKPPQKF
jgi:hypothetical protein